MAQIALTEATLDGFFTATQSAESSGDYFNNNGNTLLFIYNQSGASITVTIDSPKKCSQGHYHDKSIVIGAGGSAYIGVFPVYQFNDVNGRVNISYTSATSVYVGGIVI